MALDYDDSTIVTLTPDGKKFAVCFKGEDPGVVYFNTAQGAARFVALLAHHHQPVYFTERARERFAKELPPAEVSDEQE